MQKLTILVLITLLIIPTLTTAQDGWETYISENGLSIDYPLEWNVLEADDDIIFTNVSDLQTGGGPVHFAPYNTGEIAVSVNDPGAGLDEMFSAEITDYSIATPEYISGILTGLYTVVYAFAMGGAFAGDGEAPSLLVRDIVQLELDYENQVVTMTDGTLDFYLITLLEFSENDATPPSMAVITVTVPTGEFEQHEETVMQMLESVVLPEAE